MSPFEQMRHYQLESAFQFPPYASGQIVELLGNVFAIEVFYVTRAERANLLLNPGVIVRLVKRGGGGLRYVAGTAHTDHLSLCRMRTPAGADFITRSSAI